MKCNLCVRGLAHVIQRVSSSSLSANDTTNPDKNLVIDKSSNSHLKGVIKPPHYRSTSGTFRGTHMLNEEFVCQADKTGHGARLYDYMEMGKMVRNLPNVAEKIRFVNPYERPWSAAEKKHHRAWLPSLFSPRKAWNICTVPRYFDCLNFYKYITKTRVEQGVDHLYEGIVLSTKKFESILVQTMIHIMESKQSEERSEMIDVILRNMIDIGLEVLGCAGDVKDYRISYASRCESFWVRSGFLSMYETKEIDDELSRIDRGALRKFSCDDRRKLGELAFVVRDQLCAQLRRRNPMTALFTETEKMNMPIFNDETILNDIILSPKVYGMWPDDQPLWQCPGFEPDSGDEYRFGQIAVKNCDTLNALCSYWNVQGDEELMVRKDCFSAAAVASLFSWLNGQAHSLGFTQYNDIEQPIVSQMVFSDGVDFFFAVGQLNTIAINIDVEGFVNNKTNVCYVDGPLKLYDRYDSQTNKFYFIGDTEVEGLNPKVLSRILQMLVKE